MQYVVFATGLLVVATTTAGLARLAGLDLGLLPLRALGRAALQLSVVAVLLRGILTVPWTVAAFVALMLTTASWTASARLKGLVFGTRAAIAGVLSGSVVAIGAVYALGLVPSGTRYLIAVGGILIGNTMTASTLSGRSFRRAATTRSGEVEGWFALGATPSRAHLDLGRESAREALLATFDQSRATGLVTLPGAFVGALFGGASPAQAAQFQLVVLAGVALAMTVTALVVTRLLGRTPLLQPQ